MNSRSMAQGKLKQKVKVPGGAKMKKKHQKKIVGPKKGARAIAPKKARKIEHNQLHKNISKALNCEIERNVMLKAKNLEAKPLNIVMAPEESASSKPTDSKA